MKLAWVALLVLVIAAAASGQQLPDKAFHFQNARPAFADGTGPTICIDGAHRSIHTLDGTYYAFGELVRGDGFRVTSLMERVDKGVPANCRVMVMANAEVAPAESERGELLKWIAGGGRLLLVMDHAPYPRYVEPLATALGVSPFNGGATYRMFGEFPHQAVRAMAERSRTTVDSVRKTVGPLGTLGEHPIVRGRPGVDRPVRTVDTFGGTAFHPAAGVRALLRVPAGTIGEIWWPQRSPADEPRYGLDGWLAGGAQQIGAGRVVILGEAAMCSAQVAGAERTPMGMNAPLAIDNAQFCLNVIRWLAGVI
jgi:hypothetical protein